MTDGFRSGPVLATLILLGGVACSAPVPGVDRGAALWDTCTPCHGVAGQGDRVLGAPAIAGLPEWYVLEQLEKFESGWRGSHPMDTLGIRMRSMVRSLDLEGDPESVSAFVATLPATEPDFSLEGGNPVAGEAVYGRVCVACHQAGGTGFEAVHAPPLIGQHDWYLLRQYRKFRDGWRGAESEDVWGQTMVANVGQADEQGILDVLAYLQSLQQTGD